MGVAGRGAEEQARRAAERVDRLRRELPTAELPTAELLEQLADAERRQHAWTAGAEGERLVAQALGDLEPDGWLLLHDVHWPGRPKANLDHVAIGPGGVVVVDAKNWSGWVSVREGVLRCGSWRKDHELEAIASAVAAVAALLPPAHRSATRGVLCVVAQDVVASSTTAGVTVVGREQLAEHLHGLEQRLTSADVASVEALLRRTLDGPVSPALTTTAVTAAGTPARREASARARRSAPRPVRRTAPVRRRARPSAMRIFLESLLRLVIALMVLVVVVAVGPQLVAHVVASFLRAPG